jgi:hypothetical protein
MVKKTIDLTKRENRTKNIAQPKPTTKDKNQTQNTKPQHPEKRELKPQFKANFIKEVETTRKEGKFTEVNDFAKKFNRE